MHRSAAAAMQSLALYLLVATFTLWALRFVNVPLGLFTFLGGAIAIGVGFGSQNIVNNFISGLILLAERPVRTGDLIQLNELFGTVEHIGARSTRITTAANLEIIVPNSTFLENNVINWTLASNMIRTSICVGVTYGSPTRIVSRLLKRAAEEHGLILDNPEPFVWFTDFGDNSLNFELHFFIQIRNMMERRRVESDIRYKINELLSDAGITVAFPQRDVHLDTVQPLNVQITPRDHDEADAPADDSRKAA
jgi:small-conductance mechanosensitive channel